jgi:hypothetical protein
MSSPVNTQIIILRPRIPVLLGSLIALNTPVQSGVCESLTPRGQFTLSAYQAGLSSVTALLECSIDQGVSWSSIPATSTFYGTTVLTGDTAAIVANRYDVSGLFGSQMRWGFTAADWIDELSRVRASRSICRSFSNLRQRCSRRVDVANCRQYRARYRVANQFAEGRIAMARGPTVLCC